MFMGDMEEMSFDRNDGLGFSRPTHTNSDEEIEDEEAEDVDDEAEKDIEEEEGTEGEGGPGDDAEGENVEESDNEEEKQKESDEETDEFVSDEVDKVGRDYYFPFSDPNPSPRPELENADNDRVEEGSYHGDNFAEDEESDKVLDDADASAKRSPSPNYSDMSQLIINPRESFTQDDKDDIPDSASKVQDLPSVYSDSDEKNVDISRDGDENGNDDIPDMRWRSFNRDDCSSNPGYDNEDIPDDVGSSITDHRESGNSDASFNEDFDVNGEPNSDAIDDEDDVESYSLSEGSGLCNIRSDIFKNQESKRMDAASFMRLESTPIDQKEKSPLVFDPDSGFKEAKRRFSSSSASSDFLPPSSLSRSVDTFIREYSRSRSMSRSSSIESGFLKPCLSPRSSSSPRSASPMARSTSPSLARSLTPEPGMEDSDDLRSMLRKRKHEDSVQDRDKLAAMLAAKDLEILLDNQRTLTLLCDERREVKQQIEEVDKRKEELERQDQELFCKIFQLKKTIQENEANLAKSKQACSSTAGDDARESSEPPPAKVQVTCKMTPVKVKQEIEVASSSRNFVSKKIILEGGSNIKLNVPTSKASTSSHSHCLQKEFERLLESNYCCKIAHGFYCDLCNVRVVSEKMMKQHIDGKRHGDSLYRRDPQRFKPTVRDLRSKLSRRKR